MDKKSLRTNIRNGVIFFLVGAVLLLLSLVIGDFDFKEWMSGDTKTIGSEEP